ncbi:MAG: exodeoxyribonuclease III [Planctomycetota bacterium]|nr:exodeoxyribonuclease III [Planctomycetota bacterium]
MLIATFNCNSVRQRLPLIISWLERHQPEALALQETKCRDEEFPKAELEKAGWRAYFRGEKSYNGVAWLTRREPIAVSFGLQDGKDDAENTSETRLAWLKINDLHLLNLYVPQGQELGSAKFKFKLAWLKRLRAFLAKHFQPQRDRLLIVGDLNMAPADIDVYDHKAIWPHVCHCQEITDAFQELMAWGMIDVFRKHLPEPGNFTFWDYRVPNALKRNLGWRIDHVLATPILAEKSRAVFVDREARSQPKPSDHTFVAVRFQGV